MTEKMSAESDSQIEGRTLDAEIAEKIFGAQWEMVGGTSNVVARLIAPPPIDWILATQYADRTTIYPGNTEVLPEYSTDISDAWKVLEKMAVPGHRVVITASGAGTFDVEWTIPDDGEDICLAEICDEPSAPLAICLAALRSARSPLEAEKKEGK